MSNLPQTPTDGNAPAFPDLTDNVPGLTKREYFAALAMNGISSHPGTHASDKTIAQCSVTQADALIAELNKEQPADG